MVHPRYRTTTRADGDLAVALDAAVLDERRQAVVARPWTWLHQVHGADVVVVEAPGAHAGATADAAVTATPGAVVAVTTADCAPVVLLADGAVGVAHAGWRGLEAGVIGAAAAALAALGHPPSRAVIGPCIRADRYEFGPAELDRVAARWGDGVRATATAGRPALDLVAGVRAALAEVGVADIADDGTCTASDATRYWSHRARGEAGRVATVAWLEGPGVIPCTVTTGEVGARLAAVRRRIEGAGGDPERVRVVGVTKGFDGSAVDRAGPGLVDLGESYAQELTAKAEGQAPGIRWHWVGRLQRNKVRTVAPLVTTWHSIDRAELGAEVARRAPGATVLAQVNTSGEPTKGGCRPEEAAALVADLRADGLDVVGLMTVAAPAPDAARAGFRTLRALADDLGLPERSMGMSDDLEVAVAEGSTLVRVGTALFGPRGAASVAFPSETTS